jgi:hypothetical protein
MFSIISQEDLKDLNNTLTEIGGYAKVDSTKALSNLFSIIADVNEKINASGKIPSMMYDEPISEFVIPEAFVPMVNKVVVLDTADLKEAEKFNIDFLNEYTLSEEEKEMLDSTASKSAVHNLTSKMRHDINSRSVGSIEPVVTLGSVLSDLTKVAWIKKLPNGSWEGWMVQGATYNTLEYFLDAGKCPMPYSNDTGYMLPIKKHAILMSMWNKLKD